MADYYVSSFATGAGTGTQASPWTLAQAMSGVVTGDRVWVKADGTYTVSANLVSTAGGATQATPPNRLYGYTSTIGDGGFATLQAASGCTSILAITGGSWWYRGLILDANGIAGTCITLGNWHQVESCVLKNFNTQGALLSNQFPSIVDSEITGGVTGATAAVNITTSQGAIVSGCEIHDNVCPGIVIASGGAGVANNLIYNNSGASSDGINCQGYASLVAHNTIHNCGRDGIRAVAQVLSPGIRNNLLTGNAGYGINFSAVGTGNGTQTSEINGNAFYGNTSGARNGAAAGVNDVTLSSLPYVNAAAFNFALNGTAGAGAACKGAGIPGTYPRGLTVSYPSIGAVQSAASGGGSGGVAPWEGAL